MKKIAIQDPMHTPGYGGIKIHDYVIDFIRIYHPAIFLTKKKYYLKWTKYALENGLRIQDYKVIFSAKKLNTSADALLSFTGQPFSPRNRMPQAFTGLKVMHLMDYMDRPIESYQALQEDGIDYIMGYGQHDIHCDFFRTYYPNYVGHTLRVPFGFHERFIDTNPFEQRQNKVVAVGSINVFGSRMSKKGHTEAMKYFLFEHKEPFMHKFRYMLTQRQKEFAPFMASRLPLFPEESKFDYDIVAELNKNKMFVCCESLFYFPAAKAYEGPASGCVMVCSDHPCFSDYGFEDGVNCIKHRQFDTEHFKNMVTHYLSNQDKLQQIQENGKLFVNENFSHSKVAEYIYENIFKLLERKK